MLGKMIVVEGLEGAGKSTAISLVQQILNDRLIKTVNTREPGGTPIAEALRDIVKGEANCSKDEHLFDKTELLLFYGARNQLVEGIIKPSLNEGLWVIGDRHDWSTRAYQGAGRGMSEEVIQGIADITLGGFKPDLVIYMDVDPRVGLKRARGRGELDRIEKMDISFFERARDKFLDLCSQEPNSIVIDASQDIMSVQDEILVKLNKWLQDNPA